MNLTEIMENEASIAKQRNKKAWLASMIALFACAGMFVMQFVCSFIVAALFPEALGEVAASIVDMVCYITYLIVPFGAAAIIFKACFNERDEHKYKYSAPKKPILYVIGAIGIGYLVNVSVNLLLGWLFQFFETPEVEGPQTAAGIFLMYISTAVLPALLEEWAFRGVILKKLMPYGKTGAIIISSVLFGVMHVDPPRVIFASAFGLLLGICYAYTGSLKIPMLIHFINNAIAVTSSVFQDSTVMYVITTIVIYAFMGFGIAALIYYLRNGISRKKINLNKPLNIGYKLTPKKYIVKTLLNPGVIPLAILYVIIFSLYYFV